MSKIEINENMVQVQIDVTNYTFTYPKVWWDSENDILYLEYGNYFSAGLIECRKTKYIIHRHEKWFFNSNPTSSFINYTIFTKKLEKYGINYILKKEFKTVDSTDKAWHDEGYRIIFATPEDEAMFVFYFSNEIILECANES